MIKRRQCDWHSESVWRPCPYTWKTICQWTILYCETYSVIQNSEKQKAEEQLCLHVRKVTKTDQLCDSVCSEWFLYASDSALDSTTAKFSNDMCACWLHVSNMVDSGRKEVPTSELCCKGSTYSVTQQRISRTWIFSEQCCGDDRSGIIVRKKYCHCPCCEGSCPCVWFLH